MKIKKEPSFASPIPKQQTEQQYQSQAIPPSNSELFRKNRKETERFYTIKAAVILPFLDGVSRKTNGWWNIMKVS